MIFTSCPDKSRLREHLEGSLFASEDAGMVSHLDECETCRALLETLAEAGEPWLAVARGLGDEPPLPSPSWKEATLGPEASCETTSGPDLGSLFLLLGLSGPAGALGRLDHYALGEVVGHGSMGVVFKGFDLKLERIVAVKVLTPYWASRPTARQRFLREARAAGAIRDQHVVAVYAVEECRGLPYLVMECITGDSLQDWLDRGNVISLEEAVRVGREVAMGLAAAHAHGLIHRDIKPANILLDGPARRVKITDFGLARSTDDPTLTQDGIVVGTPQFMAPEQARGEPVDHRSDLFSLGGVLYRLCAGRVPFAGDGTRAVLRRVAEDAPTLMRELNPEVPDWLDQVVARLLAKDAGRRFQTASEVAELLSGGLEKPEHFALETIPVSPIKPGDLRARMPRRRRTLVATAVVLTAASLGLAEGSGVTRFSATLIRIFTADGVLAIAVDDPNVKVSIEGEGGIVITGAGPREVRLRPGFYRLNATRDGKTVKDELVTITRGGKRVVTINREPSNSLDSVDGRVLLGHIQNVYSVAFMPDGRCAVSGGIDGTIRIWDLESGKSLQKLQHGAVVWSVAVSRDGRYVFSAGSVPAGNSHVIKVWDLDAKKVIRTFEGHQSDIGCLAISRDGRFALSGSVDKTMRLWDIASGKEQKRFVGHTDLVRTVAFVSDGRRAVSGSHDGTLRLWDLETGNELHCYKGHSGHVHCAVVSPDGRRILSGGMDRRIRIWELETGKESRSIVQPTPLTWLAYSPDGRRFLSGGWDWVVRLWDASSGDVLQAFEGHQYSVTCVTFSADGRRALSGSDDATIRLWQLAP
jgi:eukaryotic-like serine/threonine-protein kinase